jgi:hypothetical protein
VREQQIMSWEEAIRKSSALPAATIGAVDRGLIATGMAADIVVFDPATVIDRATYEEPALPSEGIRYVLVNGQVALANGTASGIRGGRALFRSGNMPSRPMTTGAQRLSVKGVSAGSRLIIALDQRAGGRQATGMFTIESPDQTMAITTTQLGVLQSAEGWSSFTGVATVAPDGRSRAFTAIVDRRDPAAPGVATIVVTVEGEPFWRGALRLNEVSAK